MSPPPHRVKSRNYSVLSKFCRMDTGQHATIWLARASAALYLAALPRRSRGLWTAALIVYVLHVIFAFQFFYGWSHTFALAETARQTKELFLVDSGAGLYLNYAFTVLWIADCLWWWYDPSGYVHRSKTVDRAIHAFLAFMFLNATVVVWILRAIR